MSIELKKGNTHPSFNALWWKRSGAFTANPRGILIHRVKHVFTLREANGKKLHSCVKYWCGNGRCVSKGQEKTATTDKPPKDRLLCQFCEVKSAAARQPSADKLARRHVHVGVLRAIQICCTGVLR